MTDYANILKALRTEGMTADRKSENYRAFDELMKQGVSLPDLMQRLETLEARVKEMDEPQAEVFAVMESAVSEDPDVVKARARREEVMERILTESCMRDRRFSEADREYRATVNSAYVKAKSGP